MSNDWVDKLFAVAFAMLGAALLVIVIKMATAYERPSITPKCGVCVCHETGEKP